MAKFVKKPRIVDAWPLPRLMAYARDNWDSLPEPIKDGYGANAVVFNADNMAIRTMEGTMYATGDDWVICGIKGELYPCKRDIFLETYEPLSTMSPLWDENAKRATGSSND